MSSHKKEPDFFGFALLRSVIGLKKLASSSRQIRLKTKNNLDLVILSFLTSFSAVCKLFLELSLAPCDVISFLIGWCIYSSFFIFDVHRKSP